MAKKVESTEKFKTMIGGQALIEGIMMLGPDKSSVVVRKKDGNHLTPDAIPALLDDDMPQQALMSALRKYAK